MLLLLLLDIHIQNSGTQPTWRLRVYFRFWLFWLSTQITYTVNIKTNTSENIQINKLFTGNITHASWFGETSNLNISFSLLFSKSRSLMVFVGRDPPLSPDHSVRRRQPLAPEFRCLCHFSGTLITTASDIHPVCALFRPAPYLFRTKLASFANFAATTISLPPPNSGELVHIAIVNHWWGRSQSWSDIKFPSRCVEHTVHC